ncbi:tRNA threonylcarbamoyladenosine dehydratase [soil metagenome]
MPTNAVGKCHPPVPVRAGNDLPQCFLARTIVVILQTKIIKQMIPYWMSRTQLLLGDDITQQLMDKNVLVVGLGGVGGICAEMIARSGVGRMTIVDGDTVDLSNGNRQVAALHSTEKQLKTAVMAARIKDINPAIDVTAIAEFIKEERTVEIVEAGNYDYVVDCIDTLTPKVWLIKTCVDRKIPVVSSLGAGGKMDPSQIQVADIADSYKCKLARYVRKYLHKEGITTGVTVVFSPEEIDADKIVVTEKAFPKKSIIGTISYMPALFGCLAASVVVRALCTGNDHTLS